MFFLFEKKQNIWWLLSAEEHHRRKKTDIEYDEGRAHGGERLSDEVHPRRKNANKASDEEGTTVNIVCFVW